MPEPTKEKRKARIKHKRLDQCVQGTNDSSIVSKECVARMKYPVQQSYLSSFVSPSWRKRRSPLINRGYFVRMRAMELAISNFIKNSSGNDIVVNLGAGFDPIALNFLREGCSCSFIDVDFEHVAKEKLQSINIDAALHDLLGTTSGGWFVKKPYLILGCDLRDQSQLDVLGDIIADRSPRRILFVAEVSITYMSLDAANRVIQWSNSISGSQFVLIEQIMPAGASHPFASSMINHFHGLGTPLRCLATYPTIDRQIDRFRHLGWSCANGCDLFDVWNSLTIEQQQQVDTVEDFDEWEEFFTFCQHYCVITTTAPLVLPRTRLKKIEASCHGIKQWQLPSSIRRCFSSSARINAHQSLLFGGLRSCRMGATSLVSLGPTKLQAHSTSLIDEPGERVCHCMVDFAEGKVLMTGGRTSPHNLLKDCWTWSKGFWSRTHDLTSSRFRHCATSIDGRVVVYGGKGQQPVLDALLLWSEDQGWKVLRSLNGVDIKARWGSAICAISKNEVVILGGADGSGRLQEEIWKVKIESDGYRACKMPQSIARLGSKVCFHEQHLYVVGGVSSTLETNNISRLNIESGLFDTLENTTPFMGIGHDLTIIENSIVIFGGGGVCFSFGGYWNSVAVILTVKANNTVTIPHQNPRSIIEVHQFTKTDFIRICEQRVPVLFRAVDIGPCLRTWTNAYLKEKIGEHQVVVHSCSEPWMSFHAKNFVYEKTSVRELIDRIQSGKLVYLRSVSTDRKIPADLQQDFPEIADDYRLPKAMQEHIGERGFSSILRIAGAGTGLWLHYDVMANLLTQVCGKKKVRLFHPKHVSQLSFPPGVSSSTIKDPSLIPIECFETTLHAGDMLYIPPLWPHSAMAQEAGIAVNTFWRDLDASVYANGRDIYGNRDLRAYEEGRSKVRQLQRSFAHLPSDQASFYLQRLAKELEEVCDV